MAASLGRFGRRVTQNVVLGFFLANLLQASENVVRVHDDEAAGVSGEFVEDLLVRGRNRGGSRNSGHGTRTALTASDLCPGCRLENRRPRKSIARIVSRIIFRITESRGDEMSGLQARRRMQRRTTWLGIGGYQGAEVDGINGNVGLVAFLN